MRAEEERVRAPRAPRAALGSDGPTRNGQRQESRLAEVTPAVLVLCRPTSSSPDADPRGGVARPGPGMTIQLYVLCGRAGVRSDLCPVWRRGARPDRALQGVPVRARSADRLRCACAGGGARWVASAFRRGRGAAGPHVTRSSRHQHAIIRCIYCNLAQALGRSPLFERRSCVSAAKQAAKADRKGGAQKRVAARGTRCSMGRAARRPKHVQHQFRCAS